MASLSLNLNRMNRTKVITQAKLSAGLLAPGAPATPPVAGISEEVAAMEAAATAAQDLVDAWESIQVTQAVAKAAMDVGLKTLRNKVRAVKKMLEAKAMGDPTILAKGGFPFAAERTPSVRPRQIQNLSVTAGRMDGALDAQWNPEENSVSYQVEVTTADPLAGPWTRVKSETGSSASIPGLTSGQRAWVRIRGHGPKGEGPWSDPANKIVP